MMALLVSGCAVNPGVSTVGAGTYQVSRQSFLPYGETAALRDAAIAQAELHCAGVGGKPMVVRSVETRPPWLADNFPRADVQFRCVAP